MHVTKSNLVLPYTRYVKEIFFSQKSQKGLRFSVHVMFYHARAFHYYMSESKVKHRERPKVISQYMNDVNDRIK